MDIRLALGLTIGDPELVGAFANCLFQIWHEILPVMCQAPADSCSTKVNEILRGGAPAVRAKRRFEQFLSLAIKSDSAKSAVQSIWC